MEQRIDLADIVRGSHLLLRGGDGHPLRAQQAIEDFPQSHHAEFANAAIAVVDADGLEGRGQDAELLNDFGTGQGFVVAAVLVVFEEFDCEDGGAGDGVEGELVWEDLVSLDLHIVGKFLITGSLTLSVMGP